MIRGKGDWLLLLALFAVAFAVSVWLYGWSAERLGIFSGCWAAGVVLRLWRPWRR